VEVRVGDGMGDGAFEEGDRAGIDIGTVGEEEGGIERADDDDDRVVGIGVKMLVVDCSTIGEGSVQRF
jgi:hypothetical protein